jgi:hypothetical protein
LRHLRQNGFTRVGIVERFNRFVGPAGIRQDLFGFLDFIALGPGQGIVGVQSTGQDFAGHRRKILEDRREECTDWLMAGGRVLLYGWRKVKEKRGGKRMLWKPRIEEITLETLGLDILG